MKRFNWTWQRVLILLVVFVSLVVGLGACIAGLANQQSAVYTNAQGTPISHQEWGATNVANAKAEMALRQRKIDMCQTILTSLDGGGFEIRIGSVSDGTSTWDCGNTSGYERKPILDSIKARELLKNACAMTETGDDYKLTVISAVTDWVEVPCFYFQETSVTETSTAIATSDGVFIEPVIPVAGREYIYFPSHIWGDLLIDDTDHYAVQWAVFGQKMAYVDKTHATYNGATVSTLMRPYMPMSDLTDNDCWPYPLANHWYRWHAVNGGFVPFTHNGQESGFPDGMVLQVVDTDPLRVEFLGMYVTLDPKTASCRP